jgi:hypothetical protein
VTHASDAASLAARRIMLESGLSFSFSPTNTSLSRSNWSFFSARKGAAGATWSAKRSSGKRRGLTFSLLGLISFFLIFYFKQDNDSSTPKKNPR